MNLFSKKLAILISTVLYIGYSPLAPGTTGTLIAIPLVLILSLFSPFTYGVTTGVIFFCGVWSSGKAELFFQKKDAPPIVIDEVVGFLISMFFLPPKWQYLFLGFFLFRFLDIVKPYPANFMNKQVKGGWGIVMDDVFAGIYTNIVLQIIRFFWSLS